MKSLVRALDYRMELLPKLFQYYRLSNILNYIIINKNCIILIPVKEKICYMLVQIINDQIPSSFYFLPTAPLTSLHESDGDDSHSLIKPSHIYISNQLRIELSQPQTIVRRGKLENQSKRPSK